MTKYSLGVGPDQPDDLSNIEQRWGHIRQILTKYSHGVGSGVRCHSWSKGGNSSGGGESILLLITKEKT